MRETIRKLKHKKKHWRILFFSGYKEKSIVNILYNLNRYEIDELSLKKKNIVRKSTKSEGSDQIFDQSDQIKPHF